MDDLYDGPARTVWGMTSCLIETGMEGDHWTVQDARAMTTLADGTPRWSYFGTNHLRTGDHLTIFAPESLHEPSPLDSEEEAGDFQDGTRSWRSGVVWTPRVLWEGETEFVRHPPFSEHARGWWIHSDQVGVSLEQWAKYFLDEHICRLVTREPLHTVGRQDLRTGEFDGLYNGLYFLADRSVRWTLAEGGFQDLHSKLDQPPYDFMRQVVEHRKRT